MNYSKGFSVGKGIDNRGALQRNGVWTAADARGDFKSMSAPKNNVHFGSKGRGSVPDGGK